MAFFSIPVTTTLAVLRDMALIKSFGILYGYDSVIVSIVLLQPPVVLLMLLSALCWKRPKMFCSICVDLLFVLYFLQVCSMVGAGFGVVGLNGVIFVIIATFMFSCKRS